MAKKLKGSGNNKGGKRKGVKDVGKSLDLDFTKEEGGGGGRRPRYKKGDYLAQIVSLGRGESSDKGTPFTQVTFKFLEGKKTKGKEIAERYYLTPKSLWRIRNLLEAAGIDVPEKKKVSIPTGKLLKKKVVITLEDDEYNGRIHSVVADANDPDSVSTDSDDEDDGDDFDPSAADLDELVKYNKDNSLGVKGLKKMPLKKARKAVATAMEDSDDMEDVDLDDV